MPQVIIPSDIPSLDGSLRSHAWAFIEKLRRNDTNPGLHIEPMKQAADRRARTGRVNDGWRAVLIKLTGSDSETRYIYLGTYQHDKAIRYARNVVLQRNAQTSGAEVIRVDQAGAVATGVPDHNSHAVAESSVVPVLQAHGVTFEDLIDLGIAPLTAHEALVATSPDRLLEVAIAAPSAFQTDALLWLADGKTVPEVRAAYRVRPVPGGTHQDTDDDLIRALDHPTSRMEFTYFEEDDDLRAAIDGSFARWRVFLHPQQREHAAARTSGAFRLSGGAGTGKTVVLLHRARLLQRRNPAARIVLTTYNKTLAATLKTNLLILDKGVVLAKSPGERGIHVGTVDAVAWHLVAKAAGHGLDFEDAARILFGAPRAGLVPATSTQDVWARALRRSGDDLPEALRSTDFLESEYAYVVVPQRITTRDAYLRARRQGRGVALGRAQRAGVWTVVETYRALAAEEGTTDYDEKSMLTAIALDATARAAGRRVADHVLVDEAQDLTPARLLLLRALSAPGPDDLFVAEDSQQRIYVPRTVLARYDIHVTGRSRRLALNYRTTAQNLDYASSVLAGHEFVDLEDDAIADSGLRSARSGPVPAFSRHATAAEAYGATARTVRDWLADGVPPETIAALVRTGNEATALHQRLLRDDLPVQHVGAKDMPGGGRVVVMTMHRSKGMEFRNVVVLDAATGATRSLDRLPEGDRPDVQQRERSLLYVATTRARDRLSIICQGDASDMLPEPRSRSTATPAIGVVTATPQEERAALAREVHDTVGHSLAQIALQASAMEIVSDSPAVHEFTARIRAAARQAGAELQDLLTTLRTGADGLADVSFADLTALLNGLKEQGARITSTIVVSEGHTADRTLTRACYRIVQEAVTNAIKHATGLPVNITLRGSPNTGVTIVVNNPLPDNVSGAPRPHSGITGMIERAESIGGTLSAGPASGGFVVDARLPWRLA
ncbi:UvrD-helicase domain-containing protein [Myceligenerans pegani]|uniref:DNA 3'-5' helicase n=1 Tax=Myceligenerans pegani TaxID=2776917 RepID=A0ABR9N1M7_9MICO|nr:UvrD-helicase domain-containing protein [Myceligenerans sp. TRM 65318]MBE1877562.1 AAA family ATPase [Myceligenerans sp. TRM 65318]MBE3019833.1 AAA family ATPase [Myceligenerans sp. TRM 65318]